MSKNSYLIQFYEINICQVMIFRFYIFYNKHQMIKIGNKTRKKNRKYYRKCSNNFDDDCTIRKFFITNGIKIHFIRYQNGTFLYIDMKFFPNSDRIITSLGNDTPKFYIPYLIPITCEGFKLICSTVFLDFNECPFW